MAVSTEYSVSLSRNGCFNRVQCFTVVKWLFQSSAVFHCCQMAVSIECSVSLTRNGCFNRVQCFTVVKGLFQSSAVFHCCQMAVSIECSVSVLCRKMDASTTLS